MNDRAPTLHDLERAQRLQELGVVVRSPELSEFASQTSDFYERGGNRAMRRAAERAARRRR